MKKPVVFDLGNVVLYFDIRKAAARMAPHTAAPLEQILDTLWTSSHGIAFEEGRLTPQEFYDGARERLGLAMEFGRFTEAWNDIFTENREVISLLRDLAHRGRVVAARDEYPARRAEDLLVALRHEILVLDDGLDGPARLPPRGSGGAAWHQRAGAARPSQRK